MKTTNLEQSRKLYFNDNKRKAPSKKEVKLFIKEIIGYLFPLLSENHSKTEEKSLGEIMQLLDKILRSYTYENEHIDVTVEKFKKSLPFLFNLLTKDAQAIYAGDPAAKSLEEVIICYPGFYATLVYRIAHQLDLLSVPMIPRMLTEYSHSKTGIDIHPKAIIGESFCIDHGTGIVIGETTKIGHSVKIYQGVTLGALSVNDRSAGIKRHPTIEDYTIIYAGSTILGGNTIVGHHSIIGGNVWLTHSIAPYTVVLNQIKVHLKNNHPNAQDIIDFVI